MLDLFTPAFIFKTLAYLELYAFSESEAYLENCETSTVKHCVQIAT